MSLLRAFAGLVSVGFDWFAPVPKPRGSGGGFWNAEQPLIDGPWLGPDEPLPLVPNPIELLTVPAPSEPPFTDDEIRTLRTIIDWGRAVDDVVGDYNAIVGNTFTASSVISGATQGVRDAAGERPALSVVSEPKPEHASAGHPNDDPDPADFPTAGSGHPKLLRACADQLENYARHIACPAATYVRSLADQLRKLAEQTEQ